VKVAIDTQIVIGQLFIDEAKRTVPRGSQPDHALIGNYNIASQLDTGGAAIHKWPIRAQCLAMNCASYGHQVLATKHQRSLAHRRDPKRTQCYVNSKKVIPP
jgi:hypothetical protein